MKDFKRFMSEAVNISGDFNGTLIINGTEDQTESVGESFYADGVWEGKLYRMEIEGETISKNELAEALQDEYPGAMVHNIYPTSEIKSSIRIKNTQRYQPERLSWSD